MLVVWVRDDLILETLLNVENLKKYFPIKSGFLRKTDKFVHAVDDVTFDVDEGDHFVIDNSHDAIHSLGRTRSLNRQATEDEHKTAD